MLLSLIHRYRITGYIVTCIAILLLAPDLSHAWPAEGDWIALTNSGGYISDPDADANQCYLDIVGDSTSKPAVMIYNDGDYIYYRIRLDCDPSKSGYLQQNTWGLLVDTDQNADAYEWMVRIDGRFDEIVISQNTSQKNVGDPSDSAEVDVWTEPLDNTPGQENFKVTYAGADFPVGPFPDSDYWLEYRYPYDIWLYYMGLDENSIIRYFVGTGPSGRTLSGDIVGTSLYTDLSNPVLPSGTIPSTGSVSFVSDLTGTGNVTTAYPGDTLYVKVVDTDRNDQKTQAQTLTVIVNTPSGDSETVTLTETGVDTGIFTGSILTADASPAIFNGTLDVSPIESVLVSYLDAVDADLNKDRWRYDSLVILPSADIGISKAVSNATPNEGEVLAFTLTLENHGASDASGLQVQDLLPAGLTHISDDGGGLYNPTNGIWTVASLTDGQVRALIVNATVDAGTTGQVLVNNVSIYYNPQLDPNPANDSDSVTLTVQGAEMGLVKSVNNSTPNEGDPVIYTLTLTNNGTNDATGLIVNDVLPVGVTYSSHSGDGTFDSATGVWNGLDVNDGLSATLDITAVVSAGTSGQIITNFANIASAGQADPVQSNNYSSASIAVAGVELAVSKVANAASFDAGDSVVFTVTLDNNGTNTATGVEITDTLPSGLTYLSHIANAGNFAPGTGIWQGFTLAPGAQGWLTITATVDAGTGGSTLVNQAELTAVNETDLLSSNNLATAAINIRSADLEVTKTVNEPAPDPSAEVGFTVTVTNNGPDTATGIELLDTLSSGLTRVSNSVSAGTFDPATGIWDGFSLTSGQSATLLINATVPATSGQTETNTATITASDREDPVSDNGSATASVTVGGVDLELIKTVSNSAPAEGGSIYYEITVNNIGDYPATGIEVTDALPAGISFDSYSATQGSYNKSSAKWSTLAITNGASATLTINVTVDADSNGKAIENLARISAISESDIDITNNIDKVTIYVGSTDLSITKVVDDPTPTEGDVVSFTLTVTNDGFNNSTGVEVTDLLPAGLTYLNDDSGGLYNSTAGLWGVTNASDPFILPSGSRSLIINATVDTGTYAQTLINFAEITAANELDPVAANNLASATVTVQAADIAVLKLGDNATPNEGQDVSFTIITTNYGPHDATGLVVEDLLPAGLTYLNDDSGGLYNSTTGLWDVGSLSKLASSTLVINATADIGTGGMTLINIANVLSSDIFDPVAINNSASFEVSPISLAWPDIKMNKTVLAFWDPINLSSGNQKAIPGAVMLYNINVSNEGEGSPDTGTVTVIETIPANTEMYVGDMGGAGSGPVDFEDGIFTSGLSYTFGGISNATDSIEFSDDNGTTYAYDPDTSTGYDPLVTNFRVTFSGDFNASGGANHPLFDIRFRVRVK